MTVPPHCTSHRLYNCSARHPTNGRRPRGRHVTFASRRMHRMRVAINTKRCSGDATRSCLSRSLKLCRHATSLVTGQCVTLTLMSSLWDVDKHFLLSLETKNTLLSLYVSNITVFVDVNNNYLSLQAKNTFPPVKYFNI